MEDSNLNWQAYEYFHTEKTSTWFWVVGIIAVTAAIISILLGDIILAILILIAAITLSMHAHKAPPLTNVELNEKGIVYDNIFHPYKSLDSFWVEEDHFPKILLKSKKTLMPLIVIPVMEIHPEVIREFLRNYLQEEKLEQPFLQKLMDYLGF
jgi:hypothetical protein